jgi:hypothetical protein
MGPQYHRQWYKFAPRVVRALAAIPRWRGGMAVGILQARWPGPADEAGAEPDIKNNGIGGVLQYDSRDVAANAWTGTYAALTAMSFGGFMGGNNSYQTYLFDFRKYSPLGRHGRTLAWQIKSRIAAHDVPWTELSLVGTGYDLRGYVEGRFRDRSTLIGLVEYRQMFTRSDGTLSRHGFVVWTGAAALGKDIQNLHGIIPNGGVGYRFEVQPRSNVRIDVGVGRHPVASTHLTEAF